MGYSIHCLSGVMSTPIYASAASEASLQQAVIIPEIHLYLYLSHNELLDL
jgi:hypothetical protein